MAVSGFERTQNSQYVTWSSAEVDRRLQEIMKRIHTECVKHGRDSDYVDYGRGANIGGFIKVADAVLALGVV